MVLYLSIIAFAWIGLSILNICLGSTIWGLSPNFSFVAILMCIVFQFAVDGLLAMIIHKFPDKWFDPRKKIFNVCKAERKFLDFIRVKKWKDSVWELGGLGGFRKNKIQDQNNPEYLNQFLIESNKGVVIHLVSVLFGFLIIFIMPLKFVWTVSIPIAIVNGILNLLSTFVLRYNIPKLKVAYERAVRVRARAFKDKVLEKENEENKKIV